MIALREVVPANRTQRQATLVAFYGAKPDALEGLIKRCWETIAEVLRSDFSPYDLNQVHATIVGLESASGPGLRNLNFCRYRKKGLSMDLPGFRNSLLSGQRLPFHIQVGGFADRDYPFTSRGLRPHCRSFSIQGDKAVVMGRPIRGQPLQQAPAAIPDAVQEARLYPDILDRIRLSAQIYNILHAYHPDPADMDNDFYLRIGLINPKSLTDLTTKRLEDRVRQCLAAVHPVLVGVGLSDLYIASCQEDTLPLGSTRAWSIIDSSLNGDFWGSLYR
jgi:hypothetical protein